MAGTLPISSPGKEEFRLRPRLRGNAAIEDNLAARSFVVDLGLLAGQFDVLIFETGVGVRSLVQSQGYRLLGSEWAEALGKVKVVARGPKPAAVLRELGARQEVTFRFLNRTRGARNFSLLDERLPVARLRVAVQEYGKPVPELTMGSARGRLRVCAFRCYRWCSCPRTPVRSSPR